MTQNGTLNCEAIYLHYYWLLLMSQKKKIIASLLKFAGYFYSEIPLPFPNSSYLLEPSNPMANAEMRFLRLYNNLNKAIGLQ